MLTKTLANDALHAVAARRVSHVLAGNGDAEPGATAPILCDQYDAYRSVEARTGLKDPVEVARTVTL